MKMKSIVLSVLVSGLSLQAFAGLTQPAPVTIDTENRFASGDMATARFSKNASEAIGCGIRKVAVSDEEVISFGFCQARVSEEDDGFVFCSTQNKELLDGINSISSYSFISFAWNEDGECTRIGNSTQSHYIPNFKRKKNKS
ncbi:hypothetical protein [Pleionea sp. CnH1-48]|uniref:hypothetical protein n=1 Tax=Pleionea sp. CnH1-48 TaxID=2954494 RepID=UPI00209824E7|nr:hypothetical protein [Pleionea sp. CnH1-48]MCO7224744.1 hypothetical protein [Pleionea sp. CnH1-48]